MFDQENMVVELLDIIRFNRDKIIYDTKKRNFCVLSMRIHGSARFFYEDQIYEVKKGDLLYIPANICYSQATEGEEVIAVHFVLYKGTAPKMQLFHPQDPQMAKKLFEELYDSWHAKQAGYRCAGTARFYKLMELCIRQAAQIRVTREQAERIAPSLEYLHKAFCDPELSVGDLARRSNISEVYFRRVFKQMFGMSPVKYITQLRIEHAKTLLETYTFSVEKAAEMSGFSDVKYFGTVFKKQTGMLPSHFKRGIAF